MLNKIHAQLKSWERGLRQSFGKDISTPSGRRWAVFHNNFFDHAFLRVPWTNFYEIAPGVYRSNHPTHRRLVKYKAMGIKAVLNLRGVTPYAETLFEQESCDQLGLELHFAKMWARKAPERQYILAMIEKLRTLPRPFMFHCKSGADRAGFAAVAYLLIFEKAPVEVAKKQLSIKYVHLDFTKTGIQDYIVALYAERLKRGEIGFEEWIATEYDPVIIQKGWDERVPARDLRLPQ
jgi:protein tyrosine/serine phosphatase